jgi:uncharacterized membrane protein
MSSAKSSTHRRFRYLGHLIARYFARGVLIFAPILITVSIVHWIFVSMDGLLRPYVGTPGLGFVIVLVALLLIGWVGSLFFVDRLIALFDSWLERLPGISFIYTSVRDLFKAFVGNKRRFQHTVRARLYDSEDVWVIGFLTDEDLHSWELGEDHVAVYVPQAYNVAGQLYLLNRERVHPLPAVGAGEAMKYAATGGAIEITGAK